MQAVGNSTPGTWTVKVINNPSGQSLIYLLLPSRNRRLGITLFKFRQQWRDRLTNFPTLTWQHWLESILSSDVAAALQACERSNTTGLDSNFAI